MSEGAVHYLGDGMEMFGRLGKLQRVHGGYSMRATCGSLNVHHMCLPDEAAAEPP